MRVSLPQDWRVPAAFANRLGDTAGRQRAMTADGHLLLVLHEPPSVNEGKRGARLFWRDRGGDWRSKPLGDGSNAIKRHVAEFAARADELEKQWQAAHTASEYYDLLQSLAPLHRATRNLHLALQQAREMIPDDRDLINLRDQAADVERSLELLHADARNGLDYMVAHQAEQQAARTYEMALSAHRLNLMAALCFPVATLCTVYAAVFGHFSAHGQEPWSTPTLFYALLGTGLLGGVVLARAITWRPEKG